MKRYVRNTVDLRIGDVLPLGVMGPETVISLPRPTESSRIWSFTVRRMDGEARRIEVAREAMHTVEEQ